MEWLKEWWPIIFGVFNLFIGLVLWALHRTYASKEQVNKIEKRVEVIENTIDITGLSNMVNEVHKIKGQLEGFDKTLNQINVQLSMLVENEIKEGK